MPGYLGNKSEMIVHHLAVMKNECKIFDVKINDRVYFVPDNLEQARKEEFSPCKYCGDEKLS